MTHLVSISIGFHLY